MHDHPSPGEEVSLDPAADDDGVGFDIGLNDGPLIDDEAVFGENLALELPADTDGSLKGQAPLETGAFV